MYKTIKPADIAEENQFTFTYPTPNQCPCCHKGVDAKVLCSYSIKRNNDAIVFIVYFCSSCEMCFLGVYRCSFPDPHSSNTLKVIVLVPDGFVPRKFSEDINAFSPSFVSIYNQAMEAEKGGLHLICGMGYRKALEFLVKDYAILQTPDEKDNIEKLLLSACIDKYICHKGIKSLAKASAWLGNDETHYVKKHPEYDLEDLKAFIDSTVSFIDAELDYLKAQALLDKKKGR